MITSSKKLEYDKLVLSYSSFLQIDEKPLFAIARRGFFF